MKLFNSSITLILLVAATIASVQAQSQPTPVVVHVRAQDAKFVGTSMGGVQIVIRDANTEKILAEGITQGGTGDTQKLMQTPKKRYMQLSTPGAARYETTLSLEKPTLVRIEATGPLAQPQSAVKVTREMWLIPGKPIGGDGVMLILPGFAVDITEPRAHQSIQAAGQEGITIRANVVLMCGCPVTEGGLWDSNQYEVNAIIKRNGQEVTEMPLDFSGTSSLFEGYFTPQQTGSFEVTVYAYDPISGNTGLDKTTVNVIE